MKYVYPVVFTREKDKIRVNIPDLPGLYIFGGNVAEAIFMAQDVIEMWLWNTENNGMPIPPASSQAEIAKRCKSRKQFVSLIAVDTDKRRRRQKPAR
jgi:predicted RNase H-like HicB family nuclease